MAPTLRRNAATALRLSIVLVIATAAPMFASLRVCAEIGTAAVTDAKSEYEKKLAEFNVAQRQYEGVAQPYWTSIEEKRALRKAKRLNGEPIIVDDYVLIQPPAYTGPPRPVNPFPEPERPSEVVEVPTVPDFLKSALEQFQFTPIRPKSEIEYKKAYAKVAAAAGLTRDQAVRVYAFEAGGNGKYDVQAGLEYERPNAHAISTALGYNQLLNTNSVELMAEQRDKFLAILKTRTVKLKGGAKAALETKIEVVRRMIEFSRSVADEWTLHEQIANTPRGLAVHAMNLDIDVGPLLQTQKLLDSVIVARKKGYPHALTAAELEMMNLTGDGSGFDMISMPAEMRKQVPTSNFFQRKGYEANPVAIRNNTVAKLIAATDAEMDKESKLQGAKDLAAAF
jgi:hypothetical protein